MKKLNKITLLFILVTAVTACDSYVEIIPIAPNSENYFNSEEEYEDALIGVYDMLQTTMFNIMVGHTRMNKVDHILQKF